MKGAVPAGGDEFDMLALDEDELLLERVLDASSKKGVKVPKREKGVHMEMRSDGIDEVEVWDDGESEEPGAEDLKGFEEVEDEALPDGTARIATHEILDCIDGEEILLEEQLAEDLGTAFSSVSHYLKEICKVDLLSVEEERELARRNEQGDKASRERLIKCNLRLVISIEKRYINRGMAFSDLIEEGNIGLIKAIERFKLSKECRVSTYATWWISRSIERELANQTRTIRVPVHMSELLNRRRWLIKRLLDKNGRIPEREELVRYMHEEALDRFTKKEGVAVDDATAEKMLSALRARLGWAEEVEMLSNTLSLDHELGRGSDNGTLGDFVLIDENDTPEVALYREEIVNIVIPKALDVLTEMEQSVIRSRHGIGKRAIPQTLQQIADVYDLSRERIRQIEEKAMEKLRCHLLPERNGVMIKRMMYQSP